MFYWVSFATTEKPLHCCIVDAPNDKSVVPLTHELKINPGGSVRFHGIGIPFGKKLRDSLINRIITTEEAHAIQRDPFSVYEYVDAGRKPWFFVGTTGKTVDTAVEATQIPLSGGYIVRAEDGREAMMLGRAHKFFLGEDYEGGVCAGIQHQPGKKMDPAWINRILTAQEADYLKAAQEHRDGLMIADDGVADAPLPEVDLSIYDRDEIEYDDEDFAESSKRILNRILNRPLEAYVALPDLGSWNGTEVSRLLAEDPEACAKGMVDTKPLADEFLATTDPKEAGLLIDLAHLLSEHIENCNDPMHRFSIPTETLVAINGALIRFGHAVYEYHAAKSAELAKSS